MSDGAPSPPLEITSLLLYNHIVASGVLGGDVVRCLECVPGEVAMLTLVWVPCVMPGLHAHALLASLAAGLSLNALALPPWRSLGQEIYRGDSANTATEGIMVGLCWSASA
jgi:hypothetical protein